MLNKLPRNPQNHHVNALFAMLGATAVWGLSGPIIKYTLYYIPPFTFLFFRFLIVCLIIFPFLYFEIKKHNVTIKDFPALAVSGILGQTSLIMVFVGLKYTSSLEVAVIGIIAPLMMVAAGHYFFNDKVNKNIEIGLIITSLGTLILAIGPIIDSNSRSNLNTMRIFGNLLIVAYNLFWTAHVLWSKWIRGENSLKIKEAAKILRIALPKRKYSSQLITGISFYVGLASMIPFYILESTGKFGGTATNILSLSAGAWLGLLYMSILSSILAYNLFEWSLKYLKVTDTVIFSYISPIFTFPMAFILLGELPTKSMVIGSAIIVVGILVAERKKG